ncbi:hypothetical protein ACRAWF_33785 [Streptomyces sp. L7]
MGLESEGRAGARAMSGSTSGSWWAQPMRVRRKLLGQRDGHWSTRTPCSSLNPAMTIRAQLKQVIAARRPPWGGRVADDGRPPDLRTHPARQLPARTPPAASAQRVLIAMALSRDPKLIVADEPRPPPST